MQPEFGCYCRHIKKFDPKIKFIILIHPIELKRRIATAAGPNFSLREADDQSARHHYWFRGETWYPLHGGNPWVSSPALSRRPLRVDHGSRQSSNVPSLAALARNRFRSADRGGRPARLAAESSGFTGGKSTCCGVHSRVPGRQFGTDGCACLDAAQRTAFALVIDRAAGSEKLKGGNLNLADTH